MLTNRGAVTVTAAVPVTVESVAWTLAVAQGQGRGLTRVPSRWKATTRWCRWKTQVTESSQGRRCCRSA